MTTIDHIREILHIVAGVLVWPVMTGLLLMIALMLIALGTFAKEVWQHWQGQRQQLKSSLQRLDTAIASGDEYSNDTAELLLEKVLVDEERLRWRSLARLRLAVRVGPALGLMGTLIPMANALQGLAEGNLPALASNMVTAFAATVIGLSVSIVAYLLAAVRESWARADGQIMAFHAEKLLKSHQQKEQL